MFDLKILKICFFKKDFFPLPVSGFMFEHPTSISGAYMKIALNVLFPLINERLGRILRLSDADAWAGEGPRGAAARVRTGLRAT